MATDSLIGRNRTFPIYNADGTPFHDLVLRKGVVDSVVMSLGDKITGDLYYRNNGLQVTMQEYIEYNGVHYYLVNPPTIVREGMVADNSELKGMTRYSFEFYHPMAMLSNFPFTDVATKTGEEKYLSQNKNFSWIGKPQDYIDKLNKNLQGTQWYVRKSERFPEEKDDELSEVLTFDNQTIADALKTGYETWDIPYVVTTMQTDDPMYLQGKRFLIEYGLPSNEIYESESARQLGEPFVFRMGQGVGLKNNSRTPRNNKIVTRIAGYGSEDNIPYGYPQIVWTGNQDWDYTINNNPDAANSYPIYKGIVGGQYVKLIKHPFTRTHLMPTVYTETVNKKVNPLAVGYDPTTEIKDYYDAIASQEYPYTHEINLSSPCYDSHEFADIKPELDADRSMGIISATPLNADLTPADHWDDTMDDNGEYVQSFFKIKLPQLSFDLYACASITQEMKVNMRSGACIGCTFDVQVDWDAYKASFYDQEGNFVPDGAQRDLTKFPKSNLGEIEVVLKKENTTFGTLMPNIYQYPKADDLFVFIGISLPLSYITSAEERLDDAMKSYMLENNVYYFDYPLKFDEAFFYDHPNILEQIRPNSIIHFEYAGEELQLFVKQLTIKYENKPLPTYDITLTDNIEVVLNQIGQVADDVEKLSSLISIVRQNYSRNVWAELSKKLSKVQDDTAQGIITFMRGLVSQAYTQFGQGADFGEFVSGYLGSGTRIGSQGEIEATSLVLRSFLEVPKLVYNHVDVRVGDEWQTNGAGEIESVVIDETHPNQGTIKLRLLDGEFGTLKVGDKCKGIYHNLDGYNDTETSDDGKGGRTFAGFYTSYFVVTGVSGSHNETLRYELRPTIEVGGNTYWQNDQGQSSGMRGGFHPSAHMTFAQYSNAQDTTRQNCQYRTTTYTRMLSGMTGWDEKLENVAFQIGNTPLIASAYDVPDAGRYSMWINGDIYFAGTLNRIDSWGRAVTDYPDQGNYSETTRYHENDLVHYDGAVWRMTIDNDATIGVKPNESVIIEGVVTYPWTKWIYADSMNPAGKWSHTQTPYPANSIVNIENALYISKRSTSNPPINLLTDVTGEPLQIETGEYIVETDDVNDDWELLFDIGDITNGEDGQNAITINLTNDTDSVLTDEQGNITGSLPTTTAQLYDGVTMITSGVEWSIAAVVGCTATIGSTTGVVTVTGMSADEAKVVVQATYNGRNYTKIFTFKKLYGKDKLWIECEVDKVTQNPSSGAYTPTTITVHAYIQSGTNGEKTELTQQVNKGYMRVESQSETNHYSPYTITLANNLFVGNHLAIRLYDKNGVMQDVEDIVRIQEAAQVASSTHKYAVSTSGTTHPDTSSPDWQTTVPQVPQGQYLWCWTRVTYTDGTNVDSFTVGYAGEGFSSQGVWSHTVASYPRNSLVRFDGGLFHATQDIAQNRPPYELLTDHNGEPLQDNDGSYLVYSNSSVINGWELWVEDGTVITNQTVEYAVSSSGAQPPTSGWSVNYPATLNQGDWLWTRTTVEYNDGHKTEAYSVAYVGIDGADGQNAIRLDLDNENDTMLYNEKGGLVSGSCVSHATLYDGATPKTQGVTFAIKSATNATATISGNTITVSAISAAAVSIEISATYNNVEYTTIMTVKKLVGVDKYDIITSATSISYDTDGQQIVSGFTTNVYRTTQDGTRSSITNTTLLSDGYTLQYSLSKGAQWAALTVGTTLNPSDIAGADEVDLRIVKTNDTSVIMDRETVLVVKDGASGVSPIFYSLFVNPTALLLNASNQFKGTNTLTIEIRKTIGDSTEKVALPSGWHLRRYVGNVPTEITSVSSNVYTTTFDAQTEGISEESQINVRLIDDTNTIVALESISIAKDGSEGLQGCVTRVSEWTVDTEYRNDQGVDGTSTNAIGYIDVVAIPSNSPAAENGYLYYECKETHTSSNANKPPTNTSENNYWKQLSNVGAIYTSLLIADNAYIKFGSGNQFVITNVVNNQTLIQAGMKGDGDIRIWAGGGVAIANDTNLANAPFRVTKDGKLYATDGEFSGIIHAKSGSIDGNLLIGETLAHRYRFEFKPKEPAAGTGNYQYYSAQLIGYDNDRSSEIFSIKMGVLSTIGSAVIGYEPVISIRDSFINSQRFMFKTTISSRTYTLDGSIYTNNANLFASAYNQSGVHKYMYYGIVDGVCTLSANSGNGSVGWPTSASEVEVGGVYMNSNGYLVVRRS